VVNPSRWVWYLTRLSILLLPLLPTPGTIGLVVVLLATWIQRWREIKLRRLNWGFGILSFGMILSACLAENRGVAFLGLANFLPFFALFIALSVIIQTPRQLRRIAWLLVIPSSIVSILGLGQVFLHWETPDWVATVFGWGLVPGGDPPGRMAAVFSHANILAAYLMVVIILGMGLWVGLYRHWRRKQPLALGLGWGLSVIRALDATG